MFRFALVWILSFASLGINAIAQSPDIPEPGSVEAIAAATTDPHFVSPWVSYIPQSSDCSISREISGPHSWALPGELVGTEKAYAYARALAAASPRVRVFTIGHSEEGRDIIMLAIADEAGIRDLDRLKAATAALADPRRIDQAAAEKLIASSRPIYYFNAALHSDETGSTEAMLELAYRLAVSEQPMIQRIRETSSGADQSYFQSRRPRQNGGLVLSLSQRQNGSQHASPPVAPVLVEVHLRRHQPRHPPADARDHQGRTSHVSRVASHGGARSARRLATDDDLERHRAL